MEERKNYIEEEVAQLQRFYDDVLACQSGEIPETARPLLALENQVRAAARAFLSDGPEFFLGTILRTYEEQGDFIATSIEGMAEVLENLGAPKQKIDYDPSDFSARFYSFNPPSGVSGEYWCLGVVCPEPSEVGFPFAYYMVFDSNFEKRAFFRVDLALGKSENGEDERRRVVSEVAPKLETTRREETARVDKLGDETDGDVDEIHKIFFDPENANRYVKPVVIVEDFDKETERELRENLEEARRRLVEEDAARARRRFERIDFPSAFYDENVERCKELVLGLGASAAGEKLVEIYESSREKIETSPRFFTSREYPPARFASKIYSLKPTENDSNKYFALRIDFPEPETEGLCESAYLCFDETFERREFYAIERVEGEKSRETTLIRLEGDESPLCLRFDRFAKEEFEKELEAIRARFLKLEPPGARDDDRVEPAEDDEPEREEEVEKDDGARFEEARADFLVKSTRARFFVESECFPKVLLNENRNVAEVALNYLIDEPGEHFCAIHKLYAERRNAENDGPRQIKYEPIQFSSSVVDLEPPAGDSRRYLALRLDLPRPEVSALCARIYFLYDETLEKRAYFALERTSAPDARGPEVLLGDPDLFVLRSKTPDGKSRDCGATFSKSSFDDALLEARRIFFGEPKRQTGWLPWKEAELDDPLDPRLKSRRALRCVFSRLSETEKLDKIQSVNQARTSLERERLPSILFEPGFKDFWETLRDLVRQSTPILCALWEEYQKIRGKMEKKGAPKQRSFKPEEFSAEGFELGTDPQTGRRIGAVCAKFPKPEAGSFAVRAYMVFDELFERRAYFTIDKVWEQDLVAPTGRETTLNGIGYVEDSPALFEYGTLFFEEDPEAEEREILRIFLRDPDREEFSFWKSDLTEDLRGFLKDRFQDLCGDRARKAAMFSTFSRGMIEQKDLPSKFMTLREDDMLDLVRRIARWDLGGFLAGCANLEAAVAEGRTTAPLPTIESRAGEFFVFLFERSEKKMRFVREKTPLGKMNLAQTTYDADQFSAEAFAMLDPDGETSGAAIRINMPEPERFGLCRRIYLCFGKGNRRAYFTVEANKREGSSFEPDETSRLRGVDAKGRRLDYDATFGPGEEDEELELIREIFYDPEYPKTVLNDFLGI
ncbi:MAG: hypothetical protein IJM30_12225 [Thermoguttaceae bacterium]|nr:hypothetical protein [Thermoguttaceae bacterium]